MSSEPPNTREPPLLIESLFTGPSTQHSFKSNLQDEHRHPTDGNQVWLQMKPSDIPSILPAALEEGTANDGDTVGLTTIRKQLPLTEVVGSGGLKYSSIIPNDLRQVIPATWGIGNTYQPILRDGNNNIIEYDPKVWVIDGINNQIQFMIYKGQLNKPLNATTGLTITFWRYNGLTASNAGGAMVNLQEAYNNSIGGATPEIVLDNTRQSVDITNIAGDSLDELLTISNNAKSIQYFVAGKNYITANGATATPGVNNVIAVGSNSITNSDNTQLFGNNITINFQPGVSIFTDNNSLSFTPNENNIMYVKKDNGLMILNGDNVPAGAILPNSGNFLIKTLGPITVNSGGANVIVDSLISNIAQPMSYFIKIKALIYSVIGNTISSIESQTVAYYASNPPVFLPINSKFGTVIGANIFYSYVAPNFNILVNQTNPGTYKWYLTIELMQTEVV